MERSRSPQHISPIPATTLASSSAAAGTGGTGDLDIPPEDAAWSLRGAAVVLHAPAFKFDCALQALAHIFEASSFWLSTYAAVRFACASAAGRIYV